MTNSVFCIAMLSFLAVAAGAVAQPARPVESVTVTGTRSREVISGFVQSLVAPARMTGKIARWEEGICPATIGLKPAFATFVIRRVRDAAAQVGVPVNDTPSCKTNIHIVFTTAPQAFVDNIRATESELLGYYDNLKQRDALAKVTHPIQAWYSTETKDLRGGRNVDNAKGGGIELTIPDPDAPGRFITMVMPHAYAGSVTGSRLGDGMRSAFHNVIILADPNKLAEYEIGALADYISVLALTQLNSLDTCQQLPSIVNLLAPGCDRKTGAMTDNDIAYLRGLYKMSPDRTLRTQQDEIVYQMQQMSGGR
jgi:hypothetical protein